MRRLAAFIVAVLVTSSSVAIAAECASVWRKLDVDFEEKLQMNRLQPLDAGLKLVTNETLPRSGEVAVYLQDPSAPQTELFMETLEEVASILDLKLMRTPTPIAATIGAGVIDESGVPTEDFYDALEAFEPDAEERAELVASLFSDQTMRYFEKVKVYATSRKAPTPARRFSAIGTANPADIRTFALLSVVGSRYQKYARECEGYKGVFVFRSGFDTLQPDDLRLLDHIYSQSSGNASVIDR